MRGFGAQIKDEDISMNLVWQCILMTPQHGGRDGISEVSRQAWRAFQSVGDPSHTELWSLHDNQKELSKSLRGWITRGAHGRRRELVAWGLKAAAVRNAKQACVLVLHLHLAPVALPLASRGARLAVFLHGIEAWSPLTSLQAAALRRSVIISNSKYTAQHFCEANPTFVLSDIRVCALGAPRLKNADAASMRSVPADWEREEVCASSRSAPYALMVGRMVAGERYKGHDLLIEFWPRVLNALPKAQLVFAGDGDDRARLEMKACKLTPPGTVRFQGNVSEDALLTLYRNCSFFVLPSTQEGFGLVYLEAMRAGKACVGGRGAAEEVIVHGTTGLICDAARPEYVLKALVTLFRDRSTCECMGRAGRLRFLSQFTEEHFRKRLLRELQLPIQPRTEPEKCA